MDDKESPYLLLTWLQSGSEDMQLSALEQLCLALLQYDNNETLIKFYPPATYVSILACLCQDFDISFKLLEAIIRTLTYYMQALPHEVINRLVNTKGSLMAICMRLENPDMSNSVVNDLTQQIVKLFEELCKRDTKSLSNIGGTSYIINYMSHFNQIIHLDTIKSGFYVLYKIIDKIDPTDERLKDWVDFLSKFLDNSDNRIVEYSLHCMLSIIKNCNEKKISTNHLNIERIIDDLLEMTLHQMKFEINSPNDASDNRNETFNINNTMKLVLPKVVIDLILCMIKSSTQFLCNLLMKSKLVAILMEIIVLQYDSASMSIIQLVEGMFEQIMERSNFHSMGDTNPSGNSNGGSGINEGSAGGSSVPGNTPTVSLKPINLMGFRISPTRIFSEEMVHQYMKYHHCLLRAIKFGSLDVIKELLLSTDFDCKYKDQFGQSLLNWSCALGFTDAVNMLYARGIDITAGDMATSLHYIAAHGHAHLMETILRNQPVDFYSVDSEGQTIVDRMQSYIKLLPQSTSARYFNELIDKIEKHRNQFDPQIVLAKQYYIRQIIPVLINIYSKNYKIQIRFHLLELLFKIIRSFNEEDHKIFVEQTFEDQPLCYHFTMMIYRVILQDTGENVLEAIKIALLLKQNSHYSDHYLKLFGRMSLHCVLQNTITNFMQLNKFNDTLFKDCSTVIPLQYDSEFGNNLIPQHLKNNEIGEYQSYYWGDWNILCCPDGLNIYNEYCYGFIPTSQSCELGKSVDINSPNLAVFVLIRKDANDNFPLPLHHEETIGNSSMRNSAFASPLREDLTNRSNRHYNSTERSLGLYRLQWRQFLDNCNNENDVSLSADTAVSRDTDYSVTLISDRKASPATEHFDTLLEKYTYLMLYWKQFIMTLPFPKCHSGRIMTHKNLELSSFSNHLKIYRHKSDNDQPNASTKEIIDPDFLEISINKISGITIKTVNQLIYKTGTFNKQMGVKKIAFSKTTTEEINLKFSKCGNPLRQNVCQRIADNGALLITSINSSLHTSIESNQHSRLYSYLEKLKSYPIGVKQESDGNSGKINFDMSLAIDAIRQIFSTDSECSTVCKPTPVELYSYNFIRVLTDLIKNNAKMVNEKLHDNLLTITKLLIQLIELMETLPTTFQLHSVISEHYLSRSIHMKLVMSNCNHHNTPSNNNITTSTTTTITNIDTDPIPDLSKYNFLVMPLTTPYDIKLKLKNLLNKLPWYRANKMQYNSIKQLYQPPYCKQLNFDAATSTGKLVKGTNGLFHWLSTNGFRNMRKSINPMKLDMVTVLLSHNASSFLTSNASLYNLFNYRITVHNRESSGSQQVSKHHSSKSSKSASQHHHQSSFVSVLGAHSFITLVLSYPIGIIPNGYCLARPLVQDSEMYCLTNWTLWGSINGIHWDCLKQHDNDQSLLNSTTTGYCTWPINLSSELTNKVEGHGWNYFRIQTNSCTSFNSDDQTPNKIKPTVSSTGSVYQTGYQPPSSSTGGARTMHGSTWGFWLSSIELYGTVCAFSEHKFNEIRQSIDDYISQFKVGVYVKPSSDWSGADVCQYKLGRVTSPVKNGTILVEWIKYASLSAQSQTSAVNATTNNIALNETKCSLRNKMGLNGLYEVVIVPDNDTDYLQLSLNKSHESYIDDIGRSGVQSFAEEDAKISLSRRDTFSWIIDPPPPPPPLNPGNIGSSPLRTSSWSSQRNTRFSANKELPPPSTTVSDIKLKSMTHQTQSLLDDLPEHNSILIKSETEDIEMNDDDDDDDVEDDEDVDDDEDDENDDDDEEIDHEFDEEDDYDEEFGHINTTLPDDIFYPEEYPHLDTGHDDEITSPMEDQAIVDNGPISSSQVSSRAGTKSIIHIKDDVSSNDSKSPSKSNPLKEESKKNFSLSKQPKRKNCRLIEGPEENPKSNVTPVVPNTTSKDTVTFLPHTEHIEANDCLVELENKYMKQSSAQNRSPTSASFSARSSLPDHPYVMASSTTQQAQKQHSLSYGSNVTTAGSGLIRGPISSSEAHSNDYPRIHQYPHQYHQHHQHHHHHSSSTANRFKPVHIDHFYPGLVQFSSLDRRALPTGNLAGTNHIQSNIETINPPGLNSEMNIQSTTSAAVGGTSTASVPHASSTKSKKFGFDWSQFKFRLDIHKPISLTSASALVASNSSLMGNRNSGEASALDIDDFSRADELIYMNPGFGTSIKQTKKFTTIFDNSSNPIDQTNAISSSVSHFPIINCILNTLPYPDRILNFYPIDNVSESWHCQFTLHYGFCDKQQQPHEENNEQPHNNNKEDFCFFNCENNPFMQRSGKDIPTKQCVELIDPTNSETSLIEILQLLKSIYQLLINNEHDSTLNVDSTDISPNNTLATSHLSDFISHHLCKKSLIQLEDVWALLSRETLPYWLIEWPLEYQFLYSYEVRVNILRGYWFGISRSIEWLQQRNKPTPEFVRPSFRDDLPPPFHFLGRLKKHIAKIPRPYNNDIWSSDLDSNIIKNNRDQFWKAVCDLLWYHAECKEELEIQFQGEEGTGLGPTLEFISLLSCEFQRIDTQMWVHTDDHELSSNQMDLSEQDEEEFVSGGRESGLFPCPWPADELTEELLNRFQILGILMAKCLQDNRRIDIPLSETFLDILINSDFHFRHYNQHNYIKKFTAIYPKRGQFLQNVVNFCQAKQNFILSCSGNLKNLQSQLEALSYKILGSSFQDLCIDMNFLPLTKKYIQKPYQLLDVYTWQDSTCCRIDNDEMTLNPANSFLTDDEDLIYFCEAQTDVTSVESVNEYNAELYVKRTLQFAMNKAIKKQFDAIKVGFNRVFSIESLRMFSAKELRQLLCGEQQVMWTLDELYQYTEPLQGYTPTSPTYQYLMDLLSQLSQPDRKLFVRFITGCTSLPPGGLRNLRPRLTIVKKCARDGGPYPSVNTCMHYLKLPEYETKAQLKTHLMEACKQLGFYLN